MLWQPAGRSPPRRRQGLNLTGLHLPSSHRFVRKYQALPSLLEVLGEARGQCRSRAASCASGHAISTTKLRATHHLDGAGSVSPLPVPGSRSPSLQHRRPPHLGSERGSRAPALAAGREPWPAAARRATTPDPSGSEAPSCPAGPGPPRGSAERETNSSAQLSAADASILQPTRRSGSSTDPRGVPVHLMCTVSSTAALLPRGYLQRGDFKIALT